MGLANLDGRGGQSVPLSRLHFCMEVLGMRILAIGSILAAIGCCICLAAQEGKQTVQKVGPVRIVCMGDSITRGIREGVTAEQTYEQLLQKRLTETVGPVMVINAGIGGERTDQAIKRLDRDALAMNPDYVTLMYGTNDCHWDPGATGPRLPIDEYEANLRQMIARIREAGAVPVLVTPPPLTFALGKIVKLNPVYKERGITFETQRYVHRVRHIARQMNVPLIDIYAAYGELAVAGKNIDDYYTDGCHPNPAGHKLIADWFHEVFVDLLGARTASGKGT